MRRFIRLLSCLALAASLAAPLPAWSVQPDEILSDPAQEARARALSRELRCMVCQNQSIDDSDAPLARDLRLLVRERIVAGDSDAKVMAFLTARYGEFVLLKPRFAWNTALLWLAPGALVIGGIIGIAATMRRRRAAPIAVAPLSEDEKRRLSELVER